MSILDKPLYYLFKATPVPLASWVAHRLGVISGRQFQKRHDARALKNMAWFRPELSAAAARAKTDWMWGHIARVLAEAASFRRLVDQNRIETVGGEHLPPAGQPVVVAAAHLGNWEAASIAVGMAGHAVAGFYQPIRDKRKLELALKARAAMGWRGVPPSKWAPLEALKHLKSGGAFVLYVDEFLGGMVHAPDLGRGMPLDGNIAHAVALAARADAPLVFAYCERLGDAPEFRVTFEPVPVNASDARATILALDAKLEAAVRRLPEQWLNLHVLKISADQ